MTPIEDFTHEELMSDCKRYLLNRARRRFGEIFPTIHKKNIDDDFIIEDDIMMLWYNDRIGSTHIEKMRLN